MARALNHMSERVRALFAEQAARIARLRDEGSRDPGTGLLNRACFGGELRRVLSEADVRPRVVSACCGLPIWSCSTSSRARARTDEWLVAVAGGLQGSFDGVEDGSLARVGGAEFGILLPGLRSRMAGRSWSGCAAPAALDLQLDGARPADERGGGDLPRDETPARCWRGWIRR
jgi:GGDEF domain-containing protein